MIDILLLRFFFNKYKYQKSKCADYFSHEPNACNNQVYRS